MLSWSRNKRLVASSMFQWSSGRFNAASLMAMMACGKTGWLDDFSTAFSAQLRRYMAAFSNSLQQKID